MRGILNTLSPNKSPLSPWQGGSVPLLEGHGPFNRFSLQLWGSMTSYSLVHSNSSKNILLGIYSLIVSYRCLLTCAYFSKGPFINFPRTTWFQSCHLFPAGTLMGVHSFPNSACGEQKMPPESIVSTILPPPHMGGLHHHWLETPLTIIKIPFCFLS